MTPWLSVVGIGEDGLAGLTPAARALVDGAAVLIGGDRHLAMVPDDGRERLPWPSPLKAIRPELERRRGRPVCVLATGDPQWYGVGARLCRWFDRDEISIVPAPSAFSLACARMGWSLPDIEVLTLHGRPLATLAAHLYPGARLLALTENGETPMRAARLLCSLGYGDSRLTVLEQMGGPRENTVAATAAAWGDRSAAALNTLAIECVAGPDAALLPRVPGLPDEAYRHDGQLTKREVRAATLAVLSPIPGQLLWDVGAGCGSVAIEWLRGALGARAVAVERDPGRAKLIADNANALGTPLLTIVERTAPEALGGLDRPDAVFVGGGLTADGLLDVCWQALAPGGRLVANAVTIEGERALFECRDRIGGGLTRIAVSHAKPLGSFTGWRPSLPVTQLSARKRG